MVRLENFSHRVKMCIFKWRIILGRHELEIKFVSVEVQNRVVIPCEIAGFSLGKMAILSLSL